MKKEAKLSELRFSANQAFRADVAVEVATEIWKTLNTPYSLALLNLLNEEKFDELVSASAPSIFSESFEHDLIAQSVLAKYSGFVHHNLQPEVRAREGFIKAEAQCLRTNDSLISCSGETFEVLLAAKDEIADLLGNFDVDEFLGSCCFGPGKVQGTDSENISPYDKFVAPLTYCGNRDDLANALIQAFPSWSLAHPKGVVKKVGSLLRFVPKNAKTHRTILIESNVNMFAQKGVGKMIRRRLRKWGIDLNEGQATHRLAAKQASTSSTLTTLDLQAASDTIAKVLIRWLLPKDWFLALDAFRSHSYTDQKTTVSLQKFSSMGNGYTFELESLVFSALCRATVKRHHGDFRKILVYGDDIIVPQGEALHVVDTLTNCGFSVNWSKSNISGPFHESCGGYYYNGREIDIFYLKNPVNNAADAFLLANRLHARATSATDAKVKLAFERARSVVIRRIPSNLRDLRYPDDLGPSNRGLATPRCELNFGSYDKGLQARYFETFELVDAKQPKRMENPRAAVSALLYEMRGKQDSNLGVYYNSWIGNGREMLHPAIALRWLNSAGNAKQRYTSSDSRYVRYASDRNSVDRRGVNPDLEVRTARHFM